jgi:hypothetical protein
MDEEWFRRHNVKQMGERQVRELEEQGYDTDWFLHQLFSGYSRELFIDTGVGHRERFEALSREFATRMNMRHESRMGTLEVLETDLEKAKALARRASAQADDGAARKPDKAAGS